MNLRVPENFGYSIFAKLTYFIAAERTGNWQNHLGSTAKMLNLFAATGHSNYAKSARLYLQMMKELPKKFPDL